MGEIREGKLAMTPRMYFTLKFAALFVVALAVLAVSVLIINFLFFTLRINSHETLLGFGPNGWRIFALFFPWHLLAIDVGLIVLLQWLVRYFRIGYRVPVLYLIGGLLAAALVLGLTLDRGTPFNDALMEGAERLPPPFAAFYKGARKPPLPGSGVCRCMITAIEGNILTVEDTRPTQIGDATSTLTIVLPENDRRATTTSLKVGDIVFIAGEEDEGVIQAFGVHLEKERGGGKPRHPILIPLQAEE